MKPIPVLVIWLLSMWVAGFFVGRCTAQASERERRRYQAQLQELASERERRRYKNWLASVPSLRARIRRG